MHGYVDPFAHRVRRSIRRRPGSVVLGPVADDDEVRREPFEDIDPSSQEAPDHTGPHARPMAVGE
jgi:hypothetical protein